MGRAVWERRGGGGKGGTRSWEGLHRQLEVGKLWQGTIKEFCQTKSKEEKGFLFFLGGGVRYGGRRGGCKGY